MTEPVPVTADTTDRKVRYAVGLITEEEMAKTLQLQSIETLATWRSQKRGPPFVKLGKKVFYTVTEFGAWVQEESKRQSERPAPRIIPDPTRAVRVPISETLDF